MNKVAFGGGSMGLPKVKVSAPSPVEIARKNAYYNLIQKVNEKNGDFILEPLEQVETKVEKKGLFGAGAASYKVTVTAIIVQIKRD